MMYKIASILVVLFMATSLQVHSAEEDMCQSKANQAIEKARASQKTLFLLFERDDAGGADASILAFESAMEELHDTACAHRLSINDPEEQDVVNAYGLRGAPVPFVLVLAPNGAVLRGLPQQFTKQDLLDSMGTPAMETCLKALQDNNLVILSVQSGQSEDNQIICRQIQAFQADPRFAKNTVSILVDSEDAREARFIQQLGAQTDDGNAMTLVIAPPSQVLGKFAGMVQKQQLVSTVEQAMKGNCCSGGSCGPGGKCS